MYDVEICIGVSGSGKSTYALTKVQRDNKWYRLNRDDIRYMISGTYWKNDVTFENDVTKLFNELLIKCYRMQANVIVDNTNLREKVINEFRQILQMLSSIYQKPIRITYKVFSVNIDECIKRDSMRERSVGVDVIKKQYDNFIKITEHYKDNQVEIIHPEVAVHRDDNLPRAVICDLDGTLADNTHRNPFDYNLCDLDTPIEHVMNTISLYDQVGYNIIYLSGREDWAFDKTMEFLTKNNAPKGLLLMRKSGDHRKDRVVKREIYMNKIHNNYHVDFAIDDRLQVCAMWQEMGIPVLRNGNPYADF